MPTTMRAPSAISATRIGFFFLSGSPPSVFEAVAGEGDCGRR
jgi:hypothetical protein